MGDRLFQRAEQIGRQDAADTGQELVAAQNDRHEIVHANGVQDSEQVRRPRLPCVSADRSGFRAIIRADEVRVADECLPRLSPHGVGKHRDQGVRDIDRMAGKAGRQFLPQPPGGHMDGNGRDHDVYPGLVVQVPDQPVDAVGMNQRVGLDTGWGRILVDNHDSRIRKALPDAIDRNLPETTGAEDPEASMRVARPLILVIIHGI